MADTVILDSIAVSRPIHSSMGLYQIDGWHCYYWLLQLVSEPSIFQCVSTTDTVILTIVESKWAHPYLNAFLLDWWLILLFLTTAESKWIHPYLNGFLLDWWLIVLFSTIAGCKWTHPSLSALQDFLSPQVFWSNMHTVPKGLRLWLGYSGRFGQRIRWLHGRCRWNGWRYCGASTRMMLKSL